MATIIFALKPKRLRAASTAFSSGRPQFQSSLPLHPSSGLLPPSSRLCLASASFVQASPCFSASFVRASPPPRRCCVSGQCDTEEKGACDSGCNGGLMNSAFEYILKNGGLMREENYPYTGTDRGTCKFDKSKIVASVANFSVVSLDEDQIDANLVKNGPLVVEINAAYMQTYIGGVSCPYICSRRLNHGVLLVGYGSAAYAPARMMEKPFWIIKNHGEKMVTTRSAGDVTCVV